MAKGSKIIASLLGVIACLFLFNTTLFARADIANHHEMKTVPVKMVISPHLTLKVLNKNQKTYQLKFTNLHDTYTRILNTNEVGFLKACGLGKAMQAQKNVRIFIWLTDGGRAFELSNIAYNKKEKAITATGKDLSNRSVLNNMKNQTVFVTVFKIDIDKAFTRQWTESHDLGIMKKTTNKAAMRKRPYDFFITAGTATLTPLYDGKGDVAYDLVMKGIKTIDVSEDRSSHGKVLKKKMLPEEFWYIKNKKSVLIGQLPHDLRTVEAYFVMVSGAGKQKAQSPNEMRFFVHSVRVAHRPEYLQSKKPMSLRNVHLYIDPVIGMSDPQGW